MGEEVEVEVFVSQAAAAATAASVSLPDSTLENQTLFFFTFSSTLRVFLARTLPDSRLAKPTCWNKVIQLFF